MLYFLLPTCLLQLQGGNHKLELGVQSSSCHVNVHAKSKPQTFPAFAMFCQEKYKTKYFSCQHHNLCSKSFSTGMLEGNVRFMRFPYSNRVQMEMF